MLNGCFAIHGVRGPWDVPLDNDCYACASDPAVATVPIFERVHVSDHWRVAHAFNSALAGWLVVLPRRHVLAVADLTGAEAAEFGTLLRRVSRALVEATGCVKTYVAVFAEADGFAHLHAHVVPRHADLPADRRGPEAFAYLGVPPGERFDGAARDELAQQLSDALHRER